MELYNFRHLSLLVTIHINFKFQVNICSGLRNIIVNKFKDLIKMDLTLSKYNTKLSPNETWPAYLTCDTLKIQMIICSSFRNIQVHVKISEHFISQFLIFKCGLDLKLAQGWDGFCTLPSWDEHLSQVWRKSFH
jgi:hypothetical protein